MTIHYLHHVRFRQPTTALCGAILRESYPTKDSYNGPKNPYYKFGACYTVSKITCKPCLEKLLIIKNDEMAKIVERINQL